MNIFSDNKNFYPTPENLIQKMCSKIDFANVEYVLEPSAGKGDIIKHLQKNFRYRYRTSDMFSIDALENQPELEDILKNMDDLTSFVGSDFLSYHTLKHYDLIIMNPPFDEGDKHLLKAIDLMDHGGQIVCILNAETLKNLCTNSRKYLQTKLNDLNADIEFLQSSFVGAERSTNVEIALIYINIPADTNESKIWESLKRAQEKEDLEVPQTSDIIERDLIKNIVAQYELEVKAGCELIKEYKVLSQYLLEDLNPKRSSSPVLTLSFYSSRNGHKLDINRYIECIRLKYWRALLDKDVFKNMLTSKARERYYNDIQAMRSIEFNVENIMQLRINLSKELHNNIKDMIISVFDMITVDHSWYDNNSKTIHYFNGWKTNKCYKIGKKAILPINGYAWSIYEGVRTLSDIDKCLAFFAGTVNIDGGTTQHIENALHAREYSISCRYFDLVFYKKGSCHIIFKQEDLIKKLNLFAAQNKNWLPPSYARKPYRDMDQEERSVIDSFEGKESYQEVYNNKEKFFIENFSLPALAAV